MAKTLVRTARRAHDAAPQKHDRGTAPRGGTPTVAAGFVRGLLKFATASGARRDDLMAEAQITRAQLEDPDARVPLDRYIALMRAAKTACNDPALALHYGAAAGIAEVSLLGLIGQSCETMSEAFAQLNRYVRLAVDVDAAPERFQLQRARGELWLLDTRTNANEFPELSEWTFAQMVSWSRRLGVTALVQAVHFTHPAPAHRDAYQLALGVPVVFDSHWNAMLTNETWMTRKVALMPRYAFSVFSTRADELIAELESVKTARREVEGLLAQTLHTGTASMATVANKLGITRQSLLRRLKAEGATFEQVLDDLRHRMALNYLSGAKMSVNETAYLVGFSDPAAFSRAFKRWTGKSPSAVRKTDGGG